MHHHRYAPFMQPDLMLRSTLVVVTVGSQSSQCNTNNTFPYFHVLALYIDTSDYDRPQAPCASAASAAATATGTGVSGGESSGSSSMTFLMVGSCTGGAFAALVPFGVSAFLTSPMATRPVVATTLSIAIGGAAAAVDSADSGRLLGDTGDDMPLSEPAASTRDSPLSDVSDSRLSGRSSDLWSERAVVGVGSGEYPGLLGSFSETVSDFPPSSETRFLLAFPQPDPQPPPPELFD